jgi:glycerophosphoryl diester phosphodiesterase
MRIIFSVAILLLNVSIYAGEPMIVAHRGASRDAPENTIPAFKLAWEQGADAIEGDFHLTKDGHIVCIHDGNTKRVSKTNLVVRNSTLAELRALDVGAHQGEVFKGIVIPTIAEVFSTIPDQKTIYIEIKCGAEIIPALIEEIRKSGLKREQIVVICFEEKVLEELKAKAPQYKTSWLCNFKKQKSGAITPPLDTVFEMLTLTKADAISSNVAIPDMFIDAIREQNYEWHVWTVNDLKTAKSMKALGAKSITTDVPGYIKKNL